MNDGGTDFQFHVDLQKSEESTEEHRYADGLASFECKDIQGETVIQKGIDLEPLKKSGWVNWDHLPGPENLIGEPVEVEVSRVEDHPRLKKSGLRGLGLYFKCKLFKGLERADATWFHLTNPDRSRPLSYSIQGRSYERDGGRITKSVLRHMAITHQPILQVSFADVCKSLTTGVMQPIMLENLDKRMTSTLWGDVEKCECGELKRSGRFVHGRLGAMRHLTKCQRMSPVEGHAFLKAIITSGIAR